METEIQKITGLETNLTGNGRGDNPFCSPAIQRIKRKLYLFFYFSRGLPQVIRICLIK